MSLVLNHTTTSSNSGGSTPSTSPPLGDSPYCSSSSPPYRDTSPYGSTSPYARTSPDYKMAPVCYGDNGSFNHHPQSVFSPPTVEASTPPLREDLYFPYLVENVSKKMTPKCDISDRSYAAVYEFIKSSFSTSSASSVAIDGKIEQAMDLVKSHLMFAVREEVDILKENIKELNKRINTLEYENTVLKQYASEETMSHLQSHRQ